MERGEAATTGRRPPHSVPLPYRYAATGIAR
jgi:hypothetical protein